MAKAFGIETFTCNLHLSDVRHLQPSQSLPQKSIPRAPEKCAPYPFGLFLGWNFELIFCLFIRVLTVASCVRMTFLGEF